MEVDHYQNALKKGLVNTEKQKILKEKKKVFEKKKKYPRSIRNFEHWKVRMGVQLLRQIDFTV